MYEAYVSGICFVVLNLGPETSYDASFSKSHKCNREEWNFPSL